MLEEALNYFTTIDPWEFVGLIFGLLAVFFLIKENILTWPAGIIYCFISFYIFWNAKLYQDFGLTFFFLVMNIYGWYAWLNPTNKKSADKLLITTTETKTWVYVLLFTFLWIGSTGIFFKTYTDASLPYWDATTTGLSISAMWMTARKKIENWILWFIVDVLSTIIYFVKNLEFYGFLYLVYIGMAVAGYLNWRKLMNQQ